MMYDLGLLLLTKSLPFLWEGYGNEPKNKNEHTHKKTSAPPSELSSGSQAVVFNNSNGVTPDQVIKPELAKPRSAIPPMSTPTVFQTNMTTLHPFRSKKRIRFW
jgi:hypothetical protein